MEKTEEREKWRKKENHTRTTNHFHLLLVLEQSESLRRAQRHRQSRGVDGARAQGVEPAGHERGEGGGHLEVLGVDYEELRRTSVDW